MKKHLLLVLFLILSIVASAANLNPFAYGLKSTFDEANMNLYVEFYINAPANSVEVYAVEVDDRSKRYELYSQTTNLNAAGKISFTKNLLEVANLPQGVDLTWEVDVKGAAVSGMTFVQNDVKMYAPTSIDIDNNPENDNFGTIFCIEGKKGAYKNSGYENYISYFDGTGLYVLNADGSKRRMPYVDRERYGYNGGKLPDQSSPQTYFDDGTNFPTFAAYRVRVSDDGRIFITSLNKDGQVLWEADKELFSATTEEEWSSKTGWKKVIAAGVDGAVMATAKRNCNVNHTYCGIYSLFVAKASTGAFVAGPNVGFDVRGSGDNLQLLMLSGCKQAIVAYTPAHYYCSEYDLGAKTTWGAAPSRRIFDGNVVYYTDPQVEYDRDGNVWMCQHRGSSDGYATLVRYDKGAADPSYRSEELNHRTGAIRFNKDFTQLAIATSGGKTGSNAGGAVTIYPVKSDGWPDWDKGVEVSVADKTYHTLTDFAWDYANNLYITAKSKSGAAGECVAVYATKRSADDIVSTPAASKYQFTVACQEGSPHTVTINCKPNDGGTVTASINGNARVGLVLDQVPSCSNVTLTAEPDAAYRFVSWTINSEVVSTDASYTFYVTKDITIQANFEGNDCTNITWWNLLANGQEVEERPEEENGYPGTNERVWRWFQVEYGKYKNITLENVVDHTKDNVSSRTVPYLQQEKQFNVTGFSNENGASFKDFLAEDQPFKWLGDYIYDKAHNLTSRSSGNNNTWAYYTYLFINRTDYAVNWANNLGDLSNYAFNGTDGAKTGHNEIVWDSFIEYGKMEHWRPYWTRIACGLPSDMKYGDYTPIIWTKHTCAEGSIAGTTPSNWMKWNNVDSEPTNGTSKTHILAWRKGSTTGPIITRIQESNLALYATYVKKNINENGGVNNPENHSATNADVLQLLKNENYGDAAEHDLTVTRPLKAGMYNTICLPFSLASLDGTPLAGATVMEFTGVNKNLYDESGDPVTVLNFTEVNAIEAGKPYLIKLKADAADITGEMQFNQIPILSFITQPAEPITHGAFTFHGTIDPTPLDAGALMLVADNRLAINTEDQSVMKGLRGYFTINPMAADEQQLAALGRVYLSIKKPVTTSVPLAPEAEQPAAPKVRKVMYDGQIYILRGDEAYTITGHRVK